jgi:hypothetical protein
LLETIQLDHARMACINLQLMCLCRSAPLCADEL